MKKYWLRSTLFNLAFYIYTALICFIALPSYFVPRAAFLWVVRFYLAVYTFLERTILGLSYEVRGIENVPQNGSFIVAAKHQSAYETFKLHVLFEDPAVILKKELLSIPVWGAFLKKSDVIAIDRSSRELAMNSIIEGAQRMKAQGRPIIIFPQGTRVGVGESTKSKPYKFGVARVYEATNLPVIPLALNTGYFYPKTGWLKRPGKVVFEFLPAIEPGLKRDEFMETLETQLEEKSQELVQDARHAEKDGSSPLKALALLLILLVALGGGYSWLWFKTADVIRNLHENGQIKGAARTLIAPLTITGFPGPLQVSGGTEIIQSPEGSAQIESFTLSGFPLPFMPVQLNTGKITLKSFRYTEPLEVDSATFTMRLTGQHSADITDSLIRIGDFTASPTGTLILKEGDTPQIEMNVALTHHESLLNLLLQKKMIHPQSALVVGAGLNVFSRDGIVSLPLSLKSDTVYVGPFAVLKLPQSSNLDQASVVPATGNLPAPSQ
ncbi:MAG: 1-acyl-sn-glycerol-3-phosphate acyltransferase [Alphaproteobacteria bacterium]|nr:1-acyl-sn-glycerol-3-phosphate acyltransferase [Alphaproteobacteria bacterium]